MPTYNKLVRDYIPEVIYLSGQQCRTRVLNDEDYKKELDIKLREEAEEYFTASNAKESLEELADLIEVVRALASVHASSWEELEKLREEKAKARGGFQERVYLIDVTD